MNTTNEITARITARITGIGPKSAIPESADAVDASIYDANGQPLGCCTLLPSEDPRDGELDTWGDDITCWADDRLIAAIAAGLDRYDVVAAVRAAAQDDAHDAIGYETPEAALKASERATTEPAAVELTDGTFAGCADDTRDSDGRVHSWAYIPAGLVEIERAEPYAWRVIGEVA